MKCLLLVSPSISNTPNKFQGIEDLPSCQFRPTSSELSSTGVRRRVVPRRTVPNGTVSDCYSPSEFLVNQTEESVFSFSPRSLYSVERMSSVNVYISMKDYNRFGDSVQMGDRPDGPRRS